MLVIKSFVASKRFDICLLLSIVFSVYNDTPHYIKAVYN